MTPVLLVLVISVALAALLIRAWLRTAPDRAWKARRERASARLVHRGPGNMRAPYEEETLLFATGEIERRRTPLQGPADGATVVTRGRVEAGRVEAVLAALAGADLTPLPVEASVALPDSGFLRLSVRQGDREQVVGWPQAPASEAGRLAAARLRPLAEAITAVARAAAPAAQSAGRVRLEVSPGGVRKQPWTSVLVVEADGGVTAERTSDGQGARAGGRVPVEEVAALWALISALPPDPAAVAAIPGARGSGWYRLVVTRGGVETAWSWPMAPVGEAHALGSLQELQEVLTTLATRAGVAHTLGED